MLEIAFAQWDSMHASAAEHISRSAGKMLEIRGSLSTYISVSQKLPFEL